MPDPVNPYAAAVADAAQPTAPPANPYEAAVVQVDQANAAAVRAQMFTATGKDPEQHAKALAMADTFQVPVDAVEAARDQLHQAQKLSAVDVQNLVRQHPRLVAWLSDHDNAVIGQDDLHFLARLDASGRQLAELLSAPEDNRPDLPWWSGVVGRYARRGVVGGLDMLSAPFAVVEMAGREILGKPLTEADYADPGFSPAATIVRDQMALRAEERAAQTYRESLAQKSVGGLWETLTNPINMALPIAGGATAAVTAKAAGLAEAAVASKALTGASLVMGEQSALQALSASLDEQQRARMAGEDGPILPGIRDLGNAAVQGGIGYLTGYLGGLRGILRGLNPAPIAMRDVLADTAIQTAAGGAQGVAGAAASQAILPGQQLDGRGILESGIVGAFGGGAMGGGGALVHLRAQEVAARIRDAQAATATAGILSRAGVALVNSKTFARNGERALALLRQAVGDGTGRVYLQEEDLQPLADAAKVPAEVMRERLGITPEELAKAQATKAAIPVDVVKALGEAAKGGEAAVAAAVEKLRGRADGPNLEEARAFAETLPKELEGVQRLADEANSAEPAPRELTPVELVHQDIREQLISAGMTPERADTNAALWAARYGARAYWWNRTLAPDAPNRMDPHQEFLRDGPSVQRALPEVLTSNVNEFGARLKAQKEQRAAAWAKQDKAASQLDRTRQNQADAAASTLRERAAGDEGQALIEAAVKALAEEAKATGRIPTSGDAMRTLGADYGFKPDSSWKLTADQDAAGKLFLAAMRHRGLDLRLLGEEAALAVAKELGSEWQSLGQRIVGGLKRMVGMGEKPITYGQPAYHGTGNPDPYDRFRYDRVGGPGGEGAQAYGWGLYFAGKKDVGAYYREALTKGQVTYDGERYDPANPKHRAALALRDASGDRSKAMDAMGQKADRGDSVAAAAGQVLDKKGESVIKDAEGRLYTVEIPEDSEMLDWDKPLKEQPPTVKAAIRKIASGLGTGWAMGSPEKALQISADSLRGNGKDFYKELASVYARKQGPMAEKAASDALRAAGIPGLRYLDGTSRGAGEGSHNYVLFDDSKVAIKAYEMRQGGELRGSFEPERNIVRLFEAENLSTFAHESGHAFIEMLGKDAARPDAPAQIKADWQTVLEFTKAEGGKLGRDQHERFARAWEAYLQEGKSPATGLAGVFQRFAAWMAIVYKNLAGISRAAGFEVKLTDEVRSVMDRMLASQEEIDAARAMQHQEGLLAESEIAKAVGMDQVATAEYAARLAAARDAAAQEFMAQELRAEEARKKVLAGEQYRALADAVRAEVEAQPVYRAIDTLRRRETGPGGEAMPGLDRETVAAAYRNTGVEAERKIPARLEALGVLADKGTEGISPDLAAPLFGFDSGDALVRAMASARNKEALITGEAKVRLREQHPDLLPTRGEISERAQRAIHGKERAAVLREELVQLGRKVGKETSTRWAEDQQGAMRALAEKTVAGQQTAKLRPDIYRAAERRAAAAALEKARKAAQATAAGRTTEADRLFGEAYIEKQREALNYELHRAATAARDEAQKMGAALKKMTEPAAQERIGKAGGWEWTVAYPDGTAERFTSEEQASAAAATRPGSTWQRSSGYLEQINGILERYDMKPANARQIQRKQTLAQWVSMMEDQGIPVDLPDLPEQNGRQSWTELSVDELRAVHDAVEQIAHLARLKNNFLAAKNKAAFQAVRDELVQSIQANAKGSPRAIKAGESLTKGATLTLDGITGSLERLGDIVQRIDGYQEGGPLWEVLKRPFDEAANRKATLTTAATAKLHDLFATWEKAGDRGRVRDPFSKQHIPAIGQSLTRLERIMVALNMGNAGNRERLQQGFGWNDAQAQAVVDTLDKTDAALVRGIAELVNSYWSEIAAKQQRLTGVRPEKVEGAPFTIAGETVEGFYFPVIYDRTQSASAALRDLAQAADMVRRGAFTAATTRRGHTKARTEGSGAPLDLNPNGISRHLEQVIHDLTHHEALIDANRVLRDQEIKAAIEAHYGPAVVRTLSDALMRIGGATIRDVDGLERGMRIVTRNAGRAAMGYNVWTALQNVTGVMQSMERVGPLRFIQAMAPLVGSADGQQSLRAFVFAKSPAMARRFKLSGENMREETARGTGAIGRDAPNALRPYAMMEAIQQLVDLPTWKAAYDHALKLGKDDASAVLIADQAVVDAQSGKDVKDRAGVLEGNEFKKALTAFYAYFNSTFNLSRRAYLRTDFRDPVSIARLGGSFLLLYAIPTAITAAGLALLRPNDKRDGKPLAGRLTSETLAMMAATIPGLRELGAGLKGDQYSGPAGMRGFDTLNRLILQVRQGEADKGLGRSAVDVLGIFTGLPSTQIQRTLDGALYDIDHQTADPRPVLFGPPR